MNAPFLCLVVLESCGIGLEIHCLAPSKAVKGVCYPLNALFHRSNRCALIGTSR